MNSLHKLTVVGPTSAAQTHGVLSARQSQLLELIDRKRRYGVPAVQQDLAEELGIRRDSLNKLLARMRRVLAVHGLEVEMPCRSRPVRLAVSSLAAWD